MRGAEAIVSKCKIIGISAVKKDRIRKSYRVKELDEKLRNERTRREARLLNRAKIAGVNCPTVLEVSKFSIIMSRVNGKRPDLNKKTGLTKKAGEVLARLHGSDIVHGDFTPANLILNSEGLFVIDFGLGVFSKDVEDKAIDVLTMLKTLDEHAQKKFLDGYSNYAGVKEVIKRIEQVKGRARYA